MITPLIGNTVLKTQADTSSAADFYFSALAKRRTGELSEAEALCRKSIELAPSKLSSRVVLGEILLAQGKYIEGFEYFDNWPDLQAALGLGEVPKMPFPRWNGEPLAGKTLLVLPIQGYGDQIQYSRFLSDIAAVGCEITVVAPPALVEILNSLDATFLPINNGLRIPVHDYWTYPMSIPRWIKATPHNISGAPYLRKKRSVGKKIGIAWSGNPDHPNDSNRSASRDAFMPIYENFDVLELGIEKTGSRTFLETAELLDECRAVVSVDTSVVHLAGAIGCPCHLILPAIDPDWRWMSDKTTHWYNSVEISRQQFPGDWNGPLLEIIKSLQV